MVTQESLTTLSTSLRRLAPTPSNSRNSRLVPWSDATQPLAAYQTGATSQFELLSRLELEDSVFLDLASHAAESGIEFLCTPFSIEAARFLVDEVNVQAIKVASGDLTYTQMLRYLASTSKPILLSTGMADLVEISRALVDLEGSDVVLLHCTSQYPAPPRDANLTAIKALRDLTGDPVGFSDHFVEDVPSLMAVAMGVRVIERHFTFDSSADGPDHKASMDPEKLQSWVEAIRVADAALGSGAKAAQTVRGRHATRRSPQPRLREGPENWPHNRRERPSSAEAGRWHIATGCGPGHRPPRSARVKGRRDRHLGRHTVTAGSSRSRFALRQSGCRP